MKIDWSKYDIHYKTAEGMVAAALEWWIETQRPGYEELIPVLTWWLTWWTAHPDEVNYTQCKASLQDLRATVGSAWNPETISDILERFKQEKVDLNLLEFVDQAMEEFCQY